MKTTDLDLKGHTTGQLKTFCPECHKDRKHQSDPSLQVNLTTGGYTCWNCGAVGYLEDIIPNPYADKTKREYKTPNPSMIKAERPDPEVLDYFKGRGISEETLKLWGISYGPSFGDYDHDAPLLEDGKRPLKRDADGVPQYLRGIQFPSFEDGKLVGMKYLRPREWNPTGERMFRAFTGGKPVPFGFDKAVPGGMIVLVEGEIDALSVSEAGIPYCWSMPNGAKGFEWLELECVVEKLLAAEYIYLGPDSDADGRACREELVRRLSLLVGPERLNLIYWPPDCKDANDVLVRFGPERLKEVIEDECKPVPVDGISEVEEFVPEYLEFYANGLPKGESTGVAPDANGVSALDPLYRVMPGMVTIVTGVTNYGKSELMDEIVRCMIERHGWAFAFYSPENHPLPLHMIKVAEKYIGKPFDRSKPGHMSRDEAITAAEWMKDSFYYINPKSTPYSVDEILDRAKVLIYRKGIKGLVIDPWNYVRKDFNGLREDQFINFEVQKICTFARATGVHVWLTVHPRTLREDKDGNIKVPTVMELSGGSKFGDNADFFFAVHRDPKAAFSTGIHEVTLHVQKSRYRYAAVQGNVTIEWEPFNGRFKPLGEAHVGPGVEVEDRSEYTFSVEDGF